ncbi:MAG TPA: F0F1 ATP synthase subunit B [Acidimicrobiales bacterium]
MSATLGAIGLLAEEDQTRTSSWIFPEGPELIWGTLSFLIVAFLLWKFGWPQAKQMMNARTARIQAQLDEAAGAKAGAEEAATSIRAAKGDIDAERQRMLADADAQAARLLSDGRTRLEQEVAELMAKAESEIDSVQGRLQSEVQAEVAELAARATEQVVGQSLDDELQQQLVEDFIARVGAAS